MNPNQALCDALTKLGVDTSKLDEAALDKIRAAGQAAMRERAATSQPAAPPVARFSAGSGPMTAGPMTPQLQAVLDVLVKVGIDPTKLDGQTLDAIIAAATGRPAPGPARFTERTAAAEADRLLALTDTGKAVLRERTKPPEPARFTEPTEKRWPRRGGAG